MGSAYMAVEVSTPGVLRVVEEIGPNVSKWKIGQRVGVGFLGGQDSECEPCLRGDFANCLNPVISGITTDGGYAEVMIAEARAMLAPF